MAILSVSEHTFSRNIGAMTVYKLFNDSTSGTSDAIDAREARGVSLIVETSNDTVSAGGVILEGAVSSSYAGTWIPLCSAITPVQNEAEAASVSASANPESNAAGLPMPYVRARFSTAVTGGATVDVYIVVEK